MSGESLFRVLKAQGSLEIGGFRPNVTRTRCSQRLIRAVRHVVSAKPQPPQEASCFSSPRLQPGAVCRSDANADQRGGGTGGRSPTVQRRRRRRRSAQKKGIRYLLKAPLRRPKAKGLEIGRATS